ncbi:MAG: class I SAM-dependent methyltransferase [Elainellaceae cyanobacterium]
MTPSEQTNPSDRIEQFVSTLTPTGWFEPLYAAADGDPNHVPWAKLTPHPALQQWLSHRELDQATPRALVIGCGLGDDAEALGHHGYRTTAFDISPTAIAWCQRRFPDSGVAYKVADLFDLPSDWAQAFDLVFECRTVQALPLAVRDAAIDGIAHLVTPGGRLLVMTRLSDTVSDGPPWPLRELDLARFAAKLTEDYRQEVAGNAPQVWVEYRR